MLVGIAPAGADHDRKKRILRVAGQRGKPGYAVALPVLLAHTRRQRRLWQAPHRRGAVRRVIVAAALFVALTATARADFQEGYAAYQRGDYATALQEWLPLARQGDASAQLNLGLMYDAGRGIPRDYAEAASWYAKAAEQAYASALNNLGFMYDEGRGVPQDYVQAHLWYNLAAAQGDELARKNREIVAGKMTPEQIAEAQSLAREWKPKKS